MQKGIWKIPFPMGLSAAFNYPAASTCLLHLSIFSCKIEEKTMVINKANMENCKELRLPYVSVLSFLELLCPTGLAANRNCPPDCRRPAGTTEL
jgi:hypothetical protein